MITIVEIDTLGGNRNLKTNIKAQHMTFIPDITIQNKLNKIYYYTLQLFYAL